MDRNFYSEIDPYRCLSPSFAVSEEKLTDNLKILKKVEEETGAKILLAQKGFAMHYFYPLIREYLSGVCASGIYEARLGREEFGKEVHTYSPAYSEKDFPEIVSLSDHIIFNSFSQWKTFKLYLDKCSKKVQIGIRINPEHRETEQAIYDPCRPASRLGVTIADFEKNASSGIEGITGLHFHTLCEKNSDSLERTLQAVEKKFGRYLEMAEWINFGGGHHITRSDYDIPLLCRLIERIKKKYNAEIYLEPGEAVALDAGVLVSTVLDIVENSREIAILDTSAATHMPDVIEMPYRPMIINSALPGEKKYNYILGGVSCLAGDIIGEYSFDSRLKPGDRLIFTDMAHYSMVKTTTFNGVPLPAITALHRIKGSNGSISIEYKTVKEFKYEDFKSRLS